MPYDYEWAERSEMFADPGGRSALRRASRSNPRNLPCPTCGEPNRLTPADRLREAGDLLGIPLRDHLVLGKEGFVSIASVQGGWR